MLSLTASQQAIVDSPLKTVSWLFDVTDNAMNAYQWSTKAASIAGGVGLNSRGKRASSVSILSFSTLAPPDPDTFLAMGDRRHIAASYFGVSGGATAYAFKVIDFSGVSLSRPKTESGIMPPSELTFSVVNKDSLYSAADFEGGYVTLSLYASRAIAAEEKICGWKFLIKKVEGSYQRLDFTCEDFFQQYINGDYPGAQYTFEDTSTEWIAGVAWDAGVEWATSPVGAVITFGVKVRDIFPSVDGDVDDDCCMPLPFGTAYVPIRSAYIGADRYYVIGPTVANGAAVTYTITEVRTPRDYSVKVAYTSGSYTFTQSTKTNTDGYTFRVFQPMIAGTNPPGFTNGVFPDGDHFFDLPTQLARSDTSAMTNPADIIEYVLKDMGVSAFGIDATSFAAAHTTFDSWGLEFNGAFWKIVPREKALALLLAMCHSTLVIGETLQLRVLDSTPQKTLTAADIIRGSNDGEGSYSYAAFTRDLSDSGNLSYSPTGDSQDIGLNTLVAAKTAKTHVYSEVFSTPFVADATIAGKIARLYFQRKLLKKSEERFTAKGTCLAVEPGDFISLTGANYGGAHSVIVDSMKIGKDLSINLVCTGFSDSIDNYV